MQILAVILLTLVALVTFASPKNINIEDVFDVEDLTGYDYHNKIGIPLADAIRKAEEAELPTRITGGSFASLGQFPYQVGLINDLNSGSQSVCGGVLVGQQRVLTAAHCWWDGWNQAWRITVVAASITLFSGGQRLQSSNVVMHERWDARLYSDDIAMIFMPSVFSFSSTVAAVALPEGSQGNEFFVGEVATASGFGRTGDGINDDITISQVLSHVNLPVITNDECLRSFPFHVVFSHICVSGTGGRSTCGGDSGGPLTINRNGRALLIGLTSFGSSQGCSLGFPAVFVRITSYSSWINNLM